MKYKVAIVDNDELYLGRICRIFGEKYADKLTIYSYTSVETYQEGKESNRFDLVLYAEGIIAPQDIPQGVPAAFFVGQNDINKVDDFPAISKFQKHEMLLKQMMDLCLDRENTHYTKKNALGNITKVLLVTAAKGGIGATTIAVSAAKHYAQLGKKVLYISLEKNPSSNIFFQSTEEVTFSDVIYTLKSKKTNMISRVENIVQKDDSGVYFFKACKTLFDINELTKEDIQTFLKEICSMGSYEYIVVDAFLEFNETGHFMCEYADDILIVADGSRIGKVKLENLKNAMTIWDNQSDVRFLSKSCILFNKLDSKYGLETEKLEIPIICEIPKYRGVEENKITEEIATMQFWENVRG